MAVPISATPASLPEPGALPGAGSGGPRGSRAALSRFTKAVGRNRKATFGLVLILIFTFVALFPDLLLPPYIQKPPYSPDPGHHTFFGAMGQFARMPLQIDHPTALHWLGTTGDGRDIYTQFILGTRAVMVLAVVTGLLTTLIAMVIGVAAAYLGGLWDSVLNLITDVLLVIPLFPLLIIISVYLGKSNNVVLISVLTATGWSYTARQLRSQAQSLRNRDFLLAAKVRGERPFYIIMVEIIPTMTSLLLASFLGNALYSVLAGSGLQFLGLGDPNMYSWGTMLFLADSNQALQSGLYLWEIIPGLGIALLGVAFAFLNYAFDEIGNPALRPMRRKKIKSSARRFTPAIVAPSEASAGLPGKGSRRNGASGGVRRRMASHGSHAR